MIIYIVFIFLLHDKMCENTESSSQGLSQLSQSSKHSVEDDFLRLTPRTNIQGLKDCKYVRIYQQFYNFYSQNDCSDKFYLLWKVTTYVLFGIIKHILVEGIGGILFVGSSCFQIIVFPSKCKPLSFGMFLKRLVTNEPLFRGPKMHFCIFLNPY